MIKFLSDTLILLVYVIATINNRPDVKHAIVLLLRITVTSISNSITITFCNSKIIR